MIDREREREREREIEREREREREGIEDGGLELGQNMRNHLASRVEEGGATWMYKTRADELHRPPSSHDRQGMLLAK